MSDKYDFQPELQLIMLEEKKVLTNEQKIEQLIVKLDIMLDKVNKRHKIKR